MKSIEIKKDRFYPKLVGDVGHALIQGLLTEKGERVMRPTLGGDLPRLIFEDENIIKTSLYYILTELIREAKLNCKIVDIYVRKIGDVLYIDIAYEQEGNIKTVGFNL